MGYGLDASSPVEAMYYQAAMMRPDETMADKVNRIAQLPLHHQPGQRYTYSMGTDILGYLVELLSGMPLDEFFRQRIFEPLGMVDTDFYVPPEKMPRLAACIPLPRMAVCSTWLIILATPLNSPLACGRINRKSRLSYLVGAGWYRPPPITCVLLLLR
jgi:CubicO group peptidase (beta-lactamase class C family)